MESLTHVNGGGGGGGGGSTASSTNAAVSAAMQFLSDDMLHTLNKAIDQHNRRERQLSIPSGFGIPIIVSPETTPQRGAAPSAVDHPTITATASVNGSIAQSMLLFSALQPPAISTTSNASCPRIRSEDVIESFSRQAATLSPAAPAAAASSSPLPEPTPSSSTMETRHPTNIFEDAPPMSSATSIARSGATNSTTTTPPLPPPASNPLDPNSTSASPAPAFAFPISNSPSAIFRNKKRAQIDPTAAVPAPNGGLPPFIPTPPPIQTLPRFDKGLLATALYAMDRSELSQ
jgi:hypothetical protein